MSTQLQLKRDTTAVINNFTPAEGEVWYDTERQDLVTGTGTKAGGNRLYLDKTVTYKVPTDFGTLQEAMDYVSYKRNSNAGQVTIVIEAGFSLDKGFHIKDGDFSHVTITSEDAVVFANISNTGDTSIFGSNGSYVLVEDSSGPTWDILVDAQNTGAPDPKGITVVGPRANMTINSGAGIKNVGDRTTIAGAEPNQYGYGLLVWNGANVRANGAVITGCAQRNLWISRNARFTGANGNFSGSKGEGGSLPQDNANHGNIYCTRASWANVEGADMSNAANRSVICTRGFVNAERADFSGMLAGRSIVCERGSTIHAGEATKDGSALTKDDINLKNFNFTTGKGVIYDDFGPADSVESFNNEGGNGNFVRFPTGDMECYRSRTNPLLLSFNLANELRGTWTFPQAFANDDYFLTAEVISPNFAQSKFGRFQFQFYNATATSVDVVMRSDSLWVASDSATVMLLAKGKSA